MLTKPSLHSQEQQTAVYNYKAGGFGSSEAPGVTVFIKGADGQIFHSHMREGWTYLTAPITCSTWCPRAATNRVCPTRWPGCAGTTSTRVEKGSGGLRPQCRGRRICSSVLIGVSVTHEGESQ